MARKYVAQNERATDGSRYDRSERLLQRAIDDQKRGGSSTPEAWHYVGALGEPAFQNSWANDPNAYATESPARFKKIGAAVYVEGRVNGSFPGVPVAIFTLPAGYRPTWLLDFAPTTGLSGYYIGPDGQVYARGAGLRICCTFLAAAS